MMSADKKKVSVLFLLDLTAAFDTIDHEILLNRLESWIGLSGTTLSWFNTHLTDRNYFVSLGDYVSEKQSILYGVPQGSILGLLLFSLYICGVFSLKVIGVLKDNIKLCRLIL